MKEEVLLPLALAKQYAHHARFAGTPRQAVADGYSAVDAMLSALLIHSGQEHSRNEYSRSSGSVTIGANTARQARINRKSPARSPPDI
jgi:hypothetical protein